MRIERIELRQLMIPMVEPLVSAHGALDERALVLVRFDTDEGSTWGECVALNDPTYNSEWSGGEYAVLHQLFLPSLFTMPSVSFGSARGWLQPFVGHQSAKAAIEMALMDLELRRVGQSVASMLGAGDRTSVRTSAVVGLGDQATTNHRMERRLAEGFTHVKIKVAPGTNVFRIADLRERYPQATLSVDANGSMSWSDPEDRAALEALDGLGLTAIEQPFPVADHTSLRAFVTQARTPVAADESASSLDAVVDLLANGLSGAVVIKPGNLGGAMASLEVAEATSSDGKPAWVGGMIDGALSRAVSLAVAALPECGENAHEISPDGRWFRESLATEVVTMADGRIAVPTEPGLGVTIDESIVDRYTVRRDELRP